MELNQEAETQSIRSFQRKDENHKYGVLKYDFKIEHVPDGGKIQIRIEPMHQIKEIFASVRECKVSVGDFEVFPVHSFESRSPCADERLGVELAQYSDHIYLSYKAFRFRDGTSGIGFFKFFNLS